MILPHELENIVLDYYYSRWLFEKKRICHREIRHLWMLQEVKLFYEVFYSPTNVASVASDALHPLQNQTTYYDAIISAHL